MRTPLRVYHTQLRKVACSSEQWSTGSVQRRVVKSRRAACNGYVVMISGYNACKGVRDLGDMRSVVVQKEFLPCLQRDVRMLLVLQFYIGGWDSAGSDYPI
eukprot:3175356-Rhodomonas_salina.1